MFSIRRSDKTIRLMRRCFCLALVLLPVIASCDVANRSGQPEMVQASPANLQDPADDTAFELFRTQQFLGVPVKEYPRPQGLTGFDDLPATTPTLRFSVTSQPLSGAKPRAFYDERKQVQARGPDGAIYEAYLGHDDPKEIVSGRRTVSTAENTRQRYGTHYGYPYTPQDIFIGKRQAGRLNSTLFFRDVGSHITAPHYLAIDSQGRVHLAVADVNIYQENRLDLYWTIGDPTSGKWSEAWLIDRRGFTSWSNPWMGAWGNKVQLVWTWCNANNNRTPPGTGIFHTEWSSGGFSRKVRIVAGNVKSFDAAIDPKSGRLLIAFSNELGNDGVYVISRSADGSWTRPERLPVQISTGEDDPSVNATGGGAFIIRAGYMNTKEWVLNIK